MSGWDWAQWVVILGTGGVVGWMAALGFGSVASITEAIDRVVTNLATWTHQSLEAHAYFEGAIKAGEAADRALHEDLERLTAALALADQRVTGLTTLTEMSLASVKARDSWHQAFETSAATIGAFDALLQQHYAHVDQPRDTSDTGWRYVLLNTDGSVGSVRRATDGSAPIRIERGHGKHQSWYRLTRIDGNALIYTPEPQA